MQANRISRRSRPTARTTSSQQSCHLVSLTRSFGKGGSFKPRAATQRLQPPPAFPPLLARGKTGNSKIHPLSGCAFRLRLKVQGCRPWQPARCFAARPPFPKEGAEGCSVLIHLGKGGEHVLNVAMRPRLSARSFTPRPPLQKGGCAFARRGDLSQVLILFDALRRITSAAGLCIEPAGGHFRRRCRFQRQPSP